MSSKESQSLMSSQYDGQIIKDSKGRKITLKKPSILDRYRLYKIMGEDGSKPECVNMLYPLLYIAKIDDIVRGNPGSYNELMADLQAVGDEGLLAVCDYITTTITENSPTEEKENLKK